MQKSAEDWRSLSLVAIADYKDVRIGRITHQGGRWPPAQDEVFVERSALETLGAKIGDRIYVETPLRKKRWLTISGIHLAFPSPPRFRSRRNPQRITE